MKPSFKMRNQGSTKLHIPRTIRPVVRCSRRIAGGFRVVAAAERGKGLAQAMFARLRSLLPGGEGILFIRRDNAASLHVHTKIGMREVASFTQGGADFAIFAYIG
jgi:hypothetical protein